MGFIAIREGAYVQLALLVAHVRRFSLLIRPVLICLAVGAPAFAEDYIKPTPRPAPNAVRIPTLRATQDTGGDRGYDNFFVFWRRDTSYETAFSDLDECRIYGLETKLIALVPMYVPLGSSELNKPKSPTLYGFGLVGGVMASYLIDRAQKESYIQTEKRCMAYKGYSRFGISRATWKEIMFGEEADVLARRALIAAGPKPATESVDP